MKNKSTFFDVVQEYVLSNTRACLPFFKAGIIPELETKMKKKDEYATNKRSSSSSNSRLRD